MIGLLCPTRGRQRQFARMCDSIVATAGKNYVYVFSGSNGDDIYTDFKYPTDIPTVYMWNSLADKAYKSTDIKLFMLAADDIIFATPGWADALIEHYNALKNKIHVYHLRDSRDPEGTPHPIVTREYIDAMGYFLPPIFMHWQVDTWTVSLAKSKNVFTHLKDYMLIHEKPSDQGQGDETHNHIRRMGWREVDAATWQASQRYLSQDQNLLATKLRDNQ